MLELREKKDMRFKTIFKEGLAEGVKILVDSSTGVNYLFCWDGYAGGMTPLLDKDGNVVVTK